MGLGGANSPPDELGAGSNACSICLDVVATAGGRSTARLQCGHEFHLDCIGSAFNAKGAMQCPNCRQVEKGSWLYASGSRSLQDFAMSSWSELGMNEWLHEEDLYDIYPEMAFGIHWCPFSRLARLPRSFDEGESSPSTPLQDRFQHPNLFLEHPAASTSHPCPYVAYLQPLQQSSSSNPQVPSDGSIDGPAYQQHWTRVPMATNVQMHQAMPGNELHFHGWEHHPSHSIHNNHTGGADQASISSVTARANSDGLPRGGSLVYPFVLAHGTGAGTGGPFAPPYYRYGSNSRAHAQAPEHYQHQNSSGIHGPILGVQQRARGLAPIGPPQPSASNHAGFYLFPRTGSSGQGIQEMEVARGNPHSRQRDRFAPFPFLPLDRRELGWLGPSSHPTNVSDSGRRTSFHLHGADRLSSQGQPDGPSHRQNHAY